MNYLESEGGRCYWGQTHLLTYIMHISTPTNGVMLGGLRGRGIGCKVDVSQPIGYTESLMQPHLAYVGKIVTVFIYSGLG